MSGNVMLPRVLLRERVVILVAVAVIAALCWVYLLQLGHSMSDTAMPMSPRWTLLTFALTFFMWSVMMAGMMLPGATPMILTFAALRQRHADGTARRLAQTLFFVSGYLVVWSGVSLFATLLQWALDRLGLLSPMLATTSARLGSLLFVLAGLYQMTPVKHVCLRNCRSPFAFLFNRWRDGRNGALRMGMEHGAYCLGCCWLLMSLLFALGVMNLLWVAAITLFVFGEKLVRGGVWFTRIGGAAMMGYGIWLAVRA